jgi:hypothetical protein
MATDQEIRDAGWYGIPQQKYLQNPFEIPTAPEAPVADQGIVNTNAFNNNDGGTFYTGPTSSLISGFQTAVDDRQKRLTELNRPLAEAQFPSFKGARTSDLDGDPYGLPNVKGFSANEMYNKAAAAKAAGLDTMEMFIGNMNADQAMAYADDRIQDHKMRYATGQLGPSYIPAEKPTFNRKMNDLFYSIPGLSKPQSARDILESGYTGASSGPGILAALLGKVDNYGNLPRANQAFIAQNMGYTGPTVFGENTSGLSKDPFGINTRSAFGDYAAYTVKRAGELNESIQKSKDRWTGKFGSLDAIDPKYGKTWAQMNKNNLDMQEFYNQGKKEFEGLKEEEYENRIDKFVKNYRRPGVKDMFDKTYDGSNIHGGTTTTTTDTSTDGGGYDPNVHGPTDYGKGSDGQQSYDLNPGSGVGWSATGSGPVSNKTGRGRTDWVDGGLVSIL